MRLVRIVFCLLLFGLFISVSLALSKEEIIDLGETGFTCPLSLEEIEQDYSALSSVKDTDTNPVIFFSKVNQEKTK